MAVGKVDQPSAQVKEPKSTGKAAQPTPIAACKSANSLIAYYDEFYVRNKANLPNNNNINVNSNENINIRTVQNVNPTRTVDNTDFRLLLVIK